VDDTTELVDVWSRVQKRLDADDSIRPQHKAWIGLTRPLGLVEDTALLSAPNEFTKDYLENRLRLQIAAALSEELGRDIRVAVTVQNPDERAEAGGGDSQNSYLVPEDPDEWEPPTRVRQQLGGYTGRHGPSSFNDRDARLNPKYTFDTFVIGSSNRFTHAAAVAVAEAPAKAYNPLFIYGDSGLGKTHLLHAIGHYAQRLLPGLRTRYVSSEEFTNDFINSVRDDKMQAFQSRYRSVDLLLIDDIQFLERAERTQEEFFHTFNTLHNANKQIVISSDKSPRQLSSLEDRLRTRFEWGLITDVQTPDLETRIAILRKKAEREKLTAPDDILEYIASKVTSNIRELEGTLIRVTAFATLNREPINLPLVQTVLKDLITLGEDNIIAPVDIINNTADYFRLGIDELTGTSRAQAIATARQIAMYLCREMTNLSLPKIGQLFGGRDHTTVMHACKKIAELMKERRSIYNQVTELTTRIKQGTAYAYNGIS